MKLNEMLNLLNLNDRRVSYTQIARKAQISRTTLLKIRRDPEGAQLGTLRAIFEAMGYEMIISIQKRIE
jgi:DNA-binding phage protein